MGAPCDFCEKDMTKTKGCAAITYLRENGEEVKAIKVGDEGDWSAGPNEKCHDCAAHYGHYHHPGCDNERCRLCGGQMISCRCDYTGKLIVEKRK